MTLDDGTRLATWVKEPSPPALPSAADVSTVVLVHGWTLTSAAWDRVVAALTVRCPGARVVRFDQRGHGWSRAAADAGAASIGRLGNDLAQVVEHHAAEGPLVLAGHSMGGMAVLSALRNHPGLLAERRCGVLLCSTTAGGLSATGRPVASIMAALAALPSGFMVPRAPVVLTQRASYGPQVDPALVRETLRAMGPVSGRTTGEWFAALMAHDETAALPAVAAAGVAVRVLVGDADRLTPLSHAAALVEGVPGAVLRVVPGAGHMLFVERPDVVVDALAELLGVADPPVG